LGDAVRWRELTSRLRSRVKVWLETDGEYVFGNGLAQILEAVAATGNMKQAAARLGRSYRYVWGRIKKAEAVLGRALVEAQVGGTGTRRSSLTEDARRLVANFLAFRRRVNARVRQEYARQFGRTGRDKARARL
jgi:molybdate transport system regulatory protein